MYSNYGIYKVKYISQTNLLQHCIIIVILNYLIHNIQSHYNTLTCYYIVYMISRRIQYCVD